MATTFMDTSYPFSLLRCERVIRLPQMFVMSIHRWTGLVAQGGLLRLEQPKQGVLKRIEEKKRKPKKFGKKENRGNLVLSIGFL